MRLWPIERLEGAGWNDPAIASDALARPGLARRGIARRERGITVFGYVVRVVAVWHLVVGPIVECAQGIDENDYQKQSDDEQQVKTGPFFHGTQGQTSVQKVGKLPAGGCTPFTHAGARCSRAS